MSDSRKRIKILPDHLVDVIAAGEVVERPASVVKELVENALDAGAEKIEVRIEDGGRRKIVVTDDGAGMAQDDCLLAIERHATSKIASVDDLRHLRTLGFRGEALPSIAAVGRFTMESWDGKAGSGTKITVDNGKLINVEPVGRAQGTTVILERLFGKLPARRKFLRTRETEAAWCLGAVEDAALAAPAVSFSVISDGARIMNLPPVLARAGRGASSLHDRVASLWGVDTAESLVPLSAMADGITLEGLVSPPTVTFGRRTRHKVIVNGRPVRDPVLNRVISSALAGSWPAGRFPALVLRLTVDDDLVDVNVHPSKREVRFRRTDPVAQALKAAVRDMNSPVRVSPDYIRAHSPRDYPQPAGTVPATPARESKLPFGKAVNPWESADFERDIDGFSENTGYDPESPRILGQVMGTYILVEGGNGVQVIDQHAAHERIVFNRLMARRGGKDVPVQRLAVPRVLTLSPSEAANLLASADMLNSFGFEVDEFGPSTVRITAVPSDLKEELIDEILQQLASDPDSLGRDPEEVALAVSRWACRQSVMAGQRLSGSQIAALIGELDKAESGFSCPHGRPTRVTLGPADLEKLFGRR
ncbi:MAG: DNA mismatch repair endonuclease MutL [bacterium]|nr:DNA mismatch repair endonuclease MutL [bacterium]